MRWSELRVYTKSTLHNTRAATSAQIISNENKAVGAERCIAVKIFLCLSSEKSTDPTQYLKISLLYNSDSNTAIYTEFYNSFNILKHT